MSKSVICKSLVEADAQVASEELCAFERKPERMMHLEAGEVEELQAEPHFKKARQDMACLYRDARKKNLKLKEDKYGGFGLFNQTGRKIKPRLQPLDDPVGVQKEIPSELLGQISDLSVIVGSSVQKKEHVLLGPLRYVNHSCSPNTVYFTGCTHYRVTKHSIVRLQVVQCIEQGEEITVDYGQPFFRDGGLKCQCPHVEKHPQEPEEGEGECPSRERGGHEEDQSTEQEELVVTASKQPKQPQEPEEGEGECPSRERGGHEEDQSTEQEELVVTASKQPKHPQEPEEGEGECPSRERGGHEEDQSTEQEELVATASKQPKHPQEPEEGEGECPSRERGGHEEDQSTEQEELVATASKQPKQPDVSATVKAAAELIRRTLWYPNHQSKEEEAEESEEAALIAEICLSVLEQVKAVDTVEDLSVKTSIIGDKMVRVQVSVYAIREFELTLEWDVSEQSMNACINSQPVRWKRKSSESSWRAKCQVSEDLVLKTTEGSSRPVDALTQLLVRFALHADCFIP